MTKQIELQNTCPLYPEELVTLEHPDDVLNHPSLSLLEKRAILAEWASDAHSVSGIPAVRQLPCGAIVKVDAILKALASLDEEDDPLARSELRWDRSYPRRRPVLGRAPFWSRHTDHDDDNPPPAPVAQRPFRIPTPFGDGRRERLA